MIIGFAGPKGSGKSLAAKAAEAQGYKKISFAEPLKNMCKEVFNLSDLVLHDPIAKESYPILVVLDHNSLSSLISYANRNLIPLSEEQIFKVHNHIRTFEDSKKILYTARQLLQYVGTEIFRQCVSNSYWTDVFIQKVNKNHNVNYIVDDLRFENERASIKQLGGITIQIERVGLEKKDSHASEAGITSTDFKLINNNNPEFIKEAEHLIDIISRGAGRH
jgi:hypothetical protein